MENKTIFQGGFLSHPYRIFSVTYFDADAADIGLLAACIRQKDVLGFQVTVYDSLAVEDAHGS